MVSGVAGMTAASRTMDQNATNGKSKWGMIDAPTFPQHLTNNPMPDGKPWGMRNGLDNKPYSKQIPATGVTRYYDFDVRRGVLAPDGFQKNGLFVNGEFPGPAIEANWGDWIEVRVHNNIEYTKDGKSEGTSMHFHGMPQRDTQWFDGVPGFTQCPIAPGSSFTYRFRAEVYGTSWWHSHYSAQYTAGLWGPLIIYGPNHVDYDIDLGPVMLGDYYHRDYQDIVADAVSTSDDFNIYVPFSDNSLINGKSNYNCSMAAPNSTCYGNAGLAQFSLSPGKTHRLRLMNTGAATLLHFSIDGHKMQVIANDFEPVVPYTADVVTLHVGQRTDILVKADACPTATYWMRSTLAGNCSDAYTREAKAVVSYQGYNSNIQLPNSTISPAAAKADEVTTLCRNDDLRKTIPYYPQKLDLQPDTVETINIDLFTNATGNHVWITNNRTQYTDYNTPILLEAAKANFTHLDPSANVYNFGSNKTVRIVLNTNYQSDHPMHLHGHSFQVLAEGLGPWDGKTIINPENPLRRDVHTLPRYGHLVIQYTADNPGVWTYHCHIAWHASMGLNIGILEQPKQLAEKEIPYTTRQTCVDWNNWTNMNIVEQIDAGI
ncbi:multicopper oxidase [Xylaria intraflava]|nr:multicopper oxidase [Xylaria intraflava]